MTSSIGGNLFAWDTRLPLRPSLKRTTWKTIFLFRSSHRSIFSNLLFYTSLFIMLLPGLLLSLLAASPVLADFHCDSTVVAGSDTALQSLRRLHRRQDAPAPPSTPLYVHVVAGSTSRADGYLSEQEVVGQVSQIQSLFAPHGITFTHTSAMRTWSVNSSWAGASRDNFNEMKEALHKGDYRSLNLYIRNITLADYGGTCTNPWTAEEISHIPFPTRLLRDGCIVNTLSLPGSSHSFMNQGKTAVHEIGHWFGLFHTFEDQGIRDGVNPPNPCWSGNPDDDVVDTPKMRNVGTGVCNKTQNSCAEPAGQNPIYDPVENYMSYSSDSCMDRFTEGQRVRMWAIYDKYRRE